MQNSMMIKKGRAARLLARILVLVFVCVTLMPCMVSCSDVEIGQSMFFGNYPFHADKSMKQIEWFVLHVEDDRALLVTRHNLDLKPYNSDHEEVTWETCSLRKWLNTTFLNTAFSAVEQEKIHLATLKNHDNTEYETDGGNDTKDRVFLLSVEEVEKYMPEISMRESVSTKYARGQGAYVNGSNGSSWWALRTPGYDNACMATVMTDGEISLDGDGVDSTDYALRPAMWIYLD